MTAPKLTRCPRCQSPKPELHPAMAFEGEVQVCAHEWHRSTDAGRLALKESEGK